jgi:hypothetical protein
LTCYLKVIKQELKERHIISNINYHDLGYNYHIDY